MQSAIKNIFARQIFDSRGNPTIEVDITLQNGVMGRASVPSGASTGINEAVELRDNDKNLYGGKSVFQAIKNVNTTIFEALKGMDVLNQKEIDKLLISLDGTINKSKLGANAMLGVSLACARAGASFKNIPLFEYLGDGRRMPVPMLNILNGGKHADNSVNIQEFMIVPHGAKDFRQAMLFATTIYHNLKSILKENNLSCGVGDEGGFAPNLKSDEEALKLIVLAIKKSNLTPFDDVSIALDIASSEMYSEAEKIGEKGKYYFWKTKELFTIEELINYYKGLIKKYPIMLIEDGASEEDWDGWKLLTQALGDEIQLVGDDLFVTNSSRIQKGIDNNIANSVLIKPNQIGTLTETIDAVKLSHNAGYQTLLSHRSGETEDSFIADFAVALGLGQIKTGAPCRSERLAKYNQLLRIEEYLQREN